MVIDSNLILDNSRVFEHPETCYTEIIYNNTYFNTYVSWDSEFINDLSDTINLTNNFFWFTDSAKIAQTVYGNFNFIPFATSPIAGAPGEPSSISSVRALEDTVSMFDKDEANIFDTVWVEVTGTDWNNHFWEGAVVILKTQEDTHGIVVGLVETDTNSGVYRGYFVVDTVSNDIENRIHADSGGYIAIIANVDRTKSDTVWLPPKTPVIYPEPAVTYGTENRVYWTPSGKEYYVECDIDTVFSNPVSSGWIRDTQYTFTNLTDGIYYYRVKARSGPLYSSSWSNVVYSYQNATEPVVPVPIAPVEDYINDTTCFIWLHSQDVFGIVGYRLQCAYDSGMSSLVFDTVTEDTYFVTFLAESTYYWWVCAEDTTGQLSSWSNVNRFFVDYTPPVFVSVTALHDTGYTGPYEVKVDVFDKYGLDSVNVFYRENQADWQCINMTLQDSVFIATLPAESVGTLVEYYFYAKDHAGNVSYSPENAPDSVYKFTVLGIGESVPVYNRVSVVNPAINNVTIFLQVKEKCLLEISIFDLAGRKVFEEKSIADRGRYKYDINGLAQGVYFVRVKIKNNAWNYKVIVMK